MNEFELNGAELNGSGEPLGLTALTFDVADAASATEVWAGSRVAESALSSSAASASDAAYVLGFLEAYSDAIDATSSATFDVAMSLTDSVEAISTVNTNGVFYWAVEDSAEAAEYIRFAVDQLVSESVTGADDWFVSTSVLLVDQLRALSSMSSTSDLVYAVAELVTALDLGDAAYLALVSEGVDATSAVATLLRATYAIIDQAVAEADATNSVVVYVPLTDEVHSDTALTGSQVLNVILSTDVVFFVKLSYNGEVYSGWVTNTTQLATSEYQGIGFNSMARVGTRYFGANEDGVFELAGSSDAGRDIHSYIQSGLLDFGSTMQKAVTNAYLAVDVDGRIAVGVGVSEKTGIAQYWYEVSMDKEAPDNVKLPIGRGLKGRYWKFEIASEALTSFDAITVLPVVMTRRV